MTGPLAGVHVLDLTEGDGAPYCAMQLGDAGADVIKVENIEGDWARQLGPPFDQGDGALFMGMNRDKHSIAVDFEMDDGRAIVRELAAQSDVLVQAFPKTEDATQLGLDYESLAADLPALIYCDISLLERRGPDADKPATDLTVQARAGLPRFLGERGKTEPYRFGSNYAGVTASMYAMQAILAAIYWRKRNGLGQKIETSYLRAMLATQQNYFTSHSDPDQPAGGGFYGAHLEPPSHGTATADGSVEFSFGYASNPNAQEELLKRLGVLERIEADDPDFKLEKGGGRGRRSEQDRIIRPYIEAAFQEHSRAEIMEILEDLGMMHAPVHDYGTLFADEGILEQDTLATVDHPTRGPTKHVGIPWKLDGTPVEIRIAPPTLGEHTDEILAGLGYDKARIQDLRQRRIVR